MGYSNPQTDYLYKPKVMKTILISTDSNVFQELISKIENIETNVIKNSKLTKDVWIDNEEMLKILKISKRTAQHYRDTKLIAFSQIGSKIYYRLCDVEELLNSHYNSSEVDRKIEHREKREYTEAQLILFGNYLLSKERKEISFSEIEDVVYHADLENWKDLETEKYIKEYEKKS